MTNIVQFEDYQKKGVNNNKNNNNFDSKVIELKDDTLSKIDDEFLLGTPDKADIKKFDELKESFGKIEGYNYLNKFIYHTAKSNYEMDPEKIPFFINTHIDKCSYEEIQNIVDEINLESKRTKLPTNSKLFLMNIRNKCMEELKKYNLN